MLILGEALASSYLYPRADYLDRCGWHESRSDRVKHITVRYTTKGKKSTEHIYAQ
jgi:hypothetical protein